MEKKEKLSQARLKTLEPLSSLSPERLSELVSLSYPELMGVGTTLFREGDVDNQTVYLLEGDVQLTSADGRIDRLLTSRMDESKYPLDDSQPRQCTAVNMSRIEVVRIDNSILDYMMMWDQLATSEEDEKNAAQASEQAAASNDDSKGWIRRVRHIMAFKSLPPANIRGLLNRMEMVNAKQGDEIIHQGDEGDYYYVLTEGEASVTRVSELARLSPGASFGEEALVSESRRNASVTMTTDGVLMRLSKEDFNALMKEPMLTRVSPDEARLRVAKGARWLDVRHAKEFQRSRLPRSTNIPLHELRMRLHELDNTTHYICYCSTGKRSAAAAFLLKQNGYHSSVLNGGLQVMASDLQKP